jgi:AraC-like DNA-binding protein
MFINLLAILIFGSLVLLGIMLMANPLQVNKKANIWFGVTLFIWASFWLGEIVFMAGGSQYWYEISGWPNFNQALAPLSFLICIRYFTNPVYKPGLGSLPYLIVPLVYLVLMILDKFLVQDFGFILIAFLFLYGLLYAFLALWLIRKHKRHIRQFASNTLEIDLAWLESIVWGTLILITGIGIFNLLFFQAPLNLFMNGFVYVIVLFTAFHSLKQKEIFPVDSKERAEVLSVVNDSESDVIQNKVITDEKLVEIKSRLHDLIVTQELYLDSDLNLGKLAHKLGITSHQLSYVVNNGFNQNFYSFINKFRVEKAKKLLADKELDKYSIIGIAFESGFNSKTSFNTTFKKFAGQTPSEYKKVRSGL